MPFLLSAWCCLSSPLQKEPAKLDLFDDIANIKDAEEYGTENIALKRQKISKIHNIVKFMYFVLICLFVCFSLSIFTFQISFTFNTLRMLLKIWRIYGTTSFIIFRYLLFLHGAGGILLSSVLTWRHGGHVGVQNNSEKSFGNLILLLCKTWATFCHCFVDQHGRLITWVKTKN